MSQEKIIPGKNIYEAYTLGQDGQVQETDFFIDSVTWSLFHDEEGQRRVEGKQIQLRGGHYIDLELVDGANSGMFFVRYIDEMVNQTLTKRVNLRGEVVEKRQVRRAQVEDMEDEEVAVPRQRRAAGASRKPGAPRAKKTDTKPNREKVR